MQTGISAIPDQDWLGSEVGGGRPIGPRRLGKRASGSGVAWLAPPGGHCIEHQFSPTLPDATPPRESWTRRRSCMTCASPSSPTQTQGMALLRWVRGSSAAGLRPVRSERTDVQYSDLLEVPAKRRRSQRPASPNAAVLSASPPPPHFPANPGPELPKFPFAPVGITEIVLVRRPSKFWDPESG